MSLFLPESDLNDLSWRKRAALCVNTLLRRLGEPGTTAERPKAPKVGETRFNTTLGKPEWWSGTAWVTW